MTELQSKLVEMLEWFHEFCKENNIKYYALGGTALGAIRHNGFIPWDDDVDVGLPRKDYDKLIALMKGKRIKNYILEQPLENKDFVYPYCKIYDTETTLIENTRYKTRRGIYLDIFPLDGVGDSYQESINNFKKVERKINWISAKTCSLNKNKKMFRNIAILFARCVPEFICGWRKTFTKVDEMCRSKSFDDCKYIVNYAGNWREREICEKKTFGESKLCKFENIEICIPNNSHDYLTKMYGDYMKFPPKEKQKTHHDYLYLDLYKGYEES